MSKNQQIEKNSQFTTVLREALSQLNENLSLFFRTIFHWWWKRTVYMM